MEAGKVGGTGTERVDRPRFALGFLSILLFSASLLGPLSAAPLLKEEEIRARRILEAYRRAFPERINAVEWLDGDWTLRIGESRFYWAKGRLLPEEDRDRWESFRPYVFYAYSSVRPDPAKYTPEKIAQLRRQGDSELRTNGIDHHGAFGNALYGASTRGQVERSLVRVGLFGRSVTVHAMISERVRSIDAAVAEAARRDEETAQFLKNLGSLGGYNWREIRGTQRMSYHSRGLAIDLQPRRLGSKVIFWEWERHRNQDWMLIPLERRWKPPDPVIAAFEAEGFIWGGNWDLFDSMHFEYRPELHELSRMAGLAVRVEDFGIETGD